jgi:hypothetical protein
MAGVNDYSSTAASNTTIGAGALDIDENCAAANINDAIRLLMKDVRDGVDSGNIFGSTIQSISGATTVVLADRGNTFIATSTLTLTLTAAATLTAGFAFWVKADSGVTVTIDPDGAETIDGSATLAVAAGSAVLVLCDGSNFFTVLTAGASDLVNDTTPQLGGDLDANGNQIKWAKGADVASGTALPVLTDGNYFDVTGTTTITSIDTCGGDGTIAPVIKLHFDGALTLTHHATDLILPGGANITTAAGDEAEFVEYAAGDWRCTKYTVAADGVGILDEDDMSSDSAIRAPSQQSVKAYTDAHGVVQIVNTSTSAVNTTTTVMPEDDTIPQNTEGSEFMTLAITPTSATNILLVQVVAQLYVTADAQIVSALFQDSTANALTAQTTYGNGTSNRAAHFYNFYMTAGTTSATTFKFRAGPAAAATLTFNGASGSRVFSTIQKSSITIMEIKP